MGIVTFSDIFIHTNALKFQVLTVILALIFTGIGFVCLFVYKNFKTLYKASVNTQAIQVTLKKLIVVFGVMALFMAFAVIMFLFVLLQRMISGMALLG